MFLTYPRPRWSVKSVFKGKKGIFACLFLFFYCISTGYAVEKQFLGKRNYYLSEVNLLPSRKETVRLTPKNVQYSYVISGKGTLLMNLSFDGGIIPSSKLIRETEDEYVELTIPDLDYEINKYPLLALTYRVENSAVQQIDGKLGIDLTGDGRVDRTIYFRKELILENWVKSGAGNNTMDFYETRLLEDWPKAYNTKDSPQGKFRVYKNGVPLEPTYGGWATEADLPVPGWSDYQELVEIGGIKHNRVVITVPKGESPQEQLYTVSYLPPARETETSPGFNRLEVNLKETVGRAVEKIREAKLVSVFLCLGKTPGIDCSTPDKKGTYSFEIKGVSIYKKRNPIVGLLAHLVFADSARPVVFILILLGYVIVQRRKIKEVAKSRIKFAKVKLATVKSPLGFKKTQGHYESSSRVPFWFTSGLIIIFIAVLFTFSLIGSLGKVSSTLGEDETILFTITIGILATLLLISAKTDKELALRFGIIGGGVIGSMFGYRGIFALILAITTCLLIYFLSLIVVQEQEK